MPKFMFTEVFVRQVVIEADNELQAQVMAEELELGSPSYDNFLNNRVVEIK